MGCWGCKPYENDDAADWLRDLWMDFPIPERVEETLRLDVETCHAQVRAAVYVLLQLGYTYQWPIDYLDRHLMMAVDGLEEMLRAKVYHDADTRREVRREIRILKSRITEARTD